LLHSICPNSCWGVDCKVAGSPTAPGVFVVGRSDCGGLASTRISCRQPQGCRAEAACAEPAGVPTRCVLSSQGSEAGERLAYGTQPIRRRREAGRLWAAQDGHGGYRRAQRAGFVRHTDVPLLLLYPSLASRFFERGMPASSQDRCHSILVARGRKARRPKFGATHCQSPVVLCMLADASSQSQGRVAALAGLSWEVGHGAALAVVSNLEQRLLRVAAQAPVRFSGICLK
jgi:hypothetical protein